MGHKHRAHKRETDTSVTRISVLLQAHAVARSTALGHQISAWMPAKARHGKGAKKAICVSCGMLAIAMPHGTYDTERAYQQMPALRGEALFVVCDQLEA